MLVERTCQICGSKESKFLYKNKIAKIEDIDLSYDLVHCSQCGFVFADHLPSQEVYEYYYRNLSKYDVFDSVENIPFVDNEIANEALIFINELKLEYSSAFDIGCSIGLLLHKINQQDISIKCRGIDPSPNSRKIAKKLFNLEIDTGFFNEVTNIDGYDLIISNSVLEHIKDFKRFIKNIKSKVKENTKLLLIVPSLNDFSNTYGEWLGELSIEHINFFNENTISILLKEIGFEVLSYKRKKLTNGQYALYVMSNYSNIIKQEPVNFDKKGVLSIKKYIKRNEDKVSKIIKKIDQIHGDYIIFGAGSHTLRLLALPEMKKKLPIKILDSNLNLQNKKIMNLPVLPPISENLDSQIPVVISSYRGIKAIKSLLNALQFKGQIITLY